MMDSTVEAMIVDGGQSTPTLATFNVLMDAHAKGADPEAAQCWFDRMSGLGIDPDVISFNVMIGCYGKARDGESALRMMQLMQDSGVQPDVMTFSAIINAMSR